MPKIRPKIQPKTSQLQEIGADGSKNVLRPSFCDPFVPTGDISAGFLAGISAGFLAGFLAGVRKWQMDRTLAIILLANFQFLN